MTSYNKHKESFFDKFDVTYEELLMSDVNAAKDFLTTEGLNLELETEAGNKLIRKFEFKLKAIHNRLRDESLLEKAFAQLKEFIDKNRGLVTEELRTLLHEVAPAYQFRNLEKLDDEEIRELLSEIDLVKLLEELDKKEK
ncbi:MAG TPA: hypothetical protein VIH57_07385 [Bacteroidales bacterium]